MTKCHNFFCEHYLPTSETCKCYEDQDWCNNCKYRKAWNRLNAWLKNPWVSETGTIYQDDVLDKLKQIKKELQDE